MKNRLLVQEQEDNPLLLGTMRLTLIGSKSAMIENFKGLIEYDNSKIILQSKKEQMILCGEHLYIPYYTKDEMKVVGTIQKIEIQVIAT